MGYKIVQLGRIELHLSWEKNGPIAFLRRIPCQVAGDLSYYT